MMKIPGPIDQIKNYQNIEDGTLARQPSPLPGTLSVNVPAAFSGSGYKSVKPHTHGPGGPRVSDHFGFSNSPKHYELWFEKRIPRLLTDTHLRFVNYINSWAKKHPDKDVFDDKTPRSSVSKFGQKFEHYGDTPQNWFERGATLGHYTIDFESPFPIKRMSGGGFKWETHMYIEDVLGAGDIPILGWIAPDRKAKLARWQVEVDCTNVKEVIISSFFRAP